MDAGREMFEQTIGLPSWAFDGLIVPLLVIVAVFAFRELLHRYLLRKGVSVEAEKRWRRLSLYLALISAMLIAGGALRFRLDSLSTALSLIFGMPAEDVASLLQRVVRSMIVTLILLVLLHAVRLAYRTGLRRLDDLVRRIHGVRLQKAVFLQENQLHAILSLGLRVSRILVVLGLFYFYIPIILTAFPATQPYAEKLMPFILGPVFRMAKAFVGYMPNLITLVLIIILVRFCLRVLRIATNALDKGDLALKGFDQEWAIPTFNLLRIVVILITVVVAYPFMPGAGSQVFKGFSMFIGAILTLGGSSTIANIICGLILTYSRSFRIGDRIQIGDTLGDVVAKTLFVTRIRTVRNEYVTFSNSAVYGGRVVNFSDAAKTGGLAVTVEAGIGYDVDWREIHRLMKAAAAETPNVLKEPEPMVLQTQLGDYAVNYLLVARTAEPKLARIVTSEIRKRMLDLFSEAKIEIMTPSVQALRNAPEPALPNQPQEDHPALSALHFLNKDLPR